MIRSQNPLHRQDAEIERLVGDFEALVLPRASWTHRAHLAVGLHYVRLYGLDGAMQQLRARIPAYNRACGNPDGYNETVTRVFLRRIAAESQANGTRCTSSEELARLERLCPVDWLYRYYSPDLIWSLRARHGWVEPDLRALDF